MQPKKLDPDKIDIQELKYRLLMVQSLEAARCVEEGVITDVREADVGSILGFGFAPFTGGTLSYIDMMGTKRFVEICKKLEKKYGDALQAAEAPARHGAEGRHLLRPLRPGRRAGGVVRSRHPEAPEVARLEGRGPSGQCFETRPRRSSP